jgi:hypothetical protein
MEPRPQSFSLFTQLPDGIEENVQVAMLLPPPMPFCPKKTVLSTLPREVDDQLIERILLRWQTQILGPPQDQIVSESGGNP